ncbi:MAG TPA: PucR family transcriptional regulator ligand-binding domain-containing protein [Solirubrobacteraceae bacterium]
MQLTVESLIDELGLELASGHEAAQTHVRWVHSTELLDPTQWLTGGELLLSTGIQLQTPKLQREFVRTLVEHRIAGLGFGTGFTHERLPAALLSAAKKLAFPVFEVPYELPFIAITERAFTHLAGEQYQTLRRTMAIQERLERLLLEERGLEEVISTAAGAIGGVVGVIDAHGETLAWHSQPPLLRDSERQAIVRQLQETPTATRHVPPVPFEPSLARWQGRILALPVMARDHAAAQAWLIGACAQHPLEDYERLILRQTVTVVALELMHLRIERETERRLAGDVLAEALTGRLHHEELQTRLRPFGIGDEAAVLAFATHDPGAAAPLLERSLAREEIRGLVATRQGLLCAVINSDGLDPIEVARGARARLITEIPDVRAAASRIAPTHSLRLSFHEARCALEAARIANGSAPEVASHADLGAFQLLLSLQDDDALVSYCRSVLGPVEDSEGEYGDELLRSLDVFIEHNGHWERAASALYCHRHTLRYRIKRIEQLTGRDFTSARDRIEFWLALRGRELAR